MIPGLFLKGIFIGLIFGVPAGAIGALTIQRTIESGFVPGIITGFGSSAADLVYGLLGVSGITVISGFITDYGHYIKIAGGIFIIILGGMVFKKKHKAAIEKSGRKTLIFYFFSSFGAAIMNPAAVLSFMAAFTTFGISGSLNINECTGLLTGILSGTIIWWLMLAGVVSVLRDRITDKIYKVLNTILGSFMLVFGAVMVIKG